MTVVERAGSTAVVAAHPGRRIRPGQVAGYVAMVCAIAIIGLPLAWLISAAFKETAEIYVVPTTWVPREPTLQNFPRAWSAAPFGMYYINTTFITAVSVIGKLFMGATTAYGLVMLRFPGKTFIFALILGALMIPPQVVIVPNYLFFADLGWVNTYQALIIPHIPTAIGAFLLRQASGTISSGL